MLHGFNGNSSGLVTSAEASSPAGKPAEAPRRRKVTSSATSLAASSPSSPDELSKLKPYTRNTKP